MGTCCSIDIRCGKFENDDMKERGYYEYYKEDEAEQNSDVKLSASGATVRLRGSSMRTSMFSQQGKKGVNQDAMTVWENFTGEKDTTFCGVFDGHGPLGHDISRFVRDQLPIKITEAIKRLVIKQERKHNHVQKNDDDTDSFLEELKSYIISAFQEVDEEIGMDTVMDGYCSGTTSVNIIKKGEHLIVTNLGDSRAVLCTRGKQNQLIPVQLTVDLKPNVPGELERIKRCKGRVFALNEEPDVYRIWMPEDDCPGLAMARAFGDFCLKDYGLISVPDISYRKLTSKDEFVVLATDGIWDVLSNADVVKIVASAKKRSLAAKLLVYKAVRAWRTKYPGSRIDDCAVVCLFFKKHQPSMMMSRSEMSVNSSNQIEVTSALSYGSVKSDGGTLVDNSLAKIENHRPDINNSINEATTVKKEHQEIVNPVSKHQRRPSESSGEKGNENLEQTDHKKTE